MKRLRRMFNPKASYSIVPCDWCGQEIGEDCSKCGGSGCIAVVTRGAA
jgi:hypothetical protein